MAQFHLHEMIVRHLADIPFSSTELIITTIGEGRNTQGACAALVFGP